MTQVHVLAFHAPYRCRHSGVCCTSRWAIPVEAPLYRSLERAIEWGQLRLDDHAGREPLFEPADDLPGSEPVVLGRRANGACLFFEPSRGNLCGIQRQIDHAHLPSACRHFPRVVAIDPRGVFVTMSHVCPTAAALLISGGSAAVVTSGAAIDGHGVWEGLDARDALPPQLSADVLWDWDSWDRWERGAVALLAADGRTPESALGRLADAVARTEAWRPEHGPLDAIVDDALDPGVCTEAPIELSDAALGTLCTMVWQSVPATLGASPHDVTFDVAGWELWAPAIRRFLAARAFANWVGYYGRGLTTWFLSVLTAYAVLRAAASNEVNGAGRPLDEVMLLRALRQADELLVHKSSARDLAAALDQMKEWR